MRKKIMITSANQSENRLQLNASESLRGLAAREQILVDSDQFSFIYIMEDQEDYTYIVIPEEIWPFLQKVLEKQSKVFVCFKEEQVELTSFFEELDYVISNIRGNSNYGEKMVKKVEETFSYN